MKEKYFSSLLPELKVRAINSTISRLGFSNNALRAYLREIFSQEYGTHSCFLADPVFEATFGWELVEQSLEDLSGTVLSKSFVDAMDAPSSHRFAKTNKPFKHQLEAWKILSQEEPQSVVVTSGTGSGKTECFMVPILDSFARQYEAEKKKLVGVQALFLYPLNALIQSQKERLHAWTSTFNGGVRFCLYNGLTRNKVPKYIRDKTPNEVIDRESLRDSPPPLLVTNATMLEYMLVRSEDIPIIDKSKGKLKWIVLDEAHTYIGSAAAELALLLRRVLYAFDVLPEQIRFIATSATIGDANAIEKLRDFLASLAGVDKSRVHVVQGVRKIPELPVGDRTYEEATLSELESIPSDEYELRYEAFCANRTAKEIRKAFIPSYGGAIAKKLSDINQIIEKKPMNSDESLRWLDLLSSVPADKKGTRSAYLPLRSHIFHNVLSGLWACSDFNCIKKTGTVLDSSEWYFGKIYTHERKYCECGSPVFELFSCNDCNTTYLLGSMGFDERTKTHRLVQLIPEFSDEFALDNEISEDDEVENQQDQSNEVCNVLITNNYLGDAKEIYIDKKTLVINEEVSPEDLSLRIVEEQHDQSNRKTLICPRCDGQHRIDKALFRKAILGAPFLLGEVIPTLLEFCPDIDDKKIKPKERPNRGRRMISFTDSRQGTARIAVKLQQEAERNRVRGLIYHYCINQTQVPNDKIKYLENEIKDLKEVQKEKKNPLIERMISNKEKELESELSKNASGIPFPKILEYLSTNEIDINQWMHEHYKTLDSERFTDNSQKLTKILVLREFARRPKRANSLETMGLVTVSYPKLDMVKESPRIQSDFFEISLNEWRDFLKIALDFYVRLNTFINLPDGWEKWGGVKLYNKYLLPPDTEEKQTSRLNRWPQVNLFGFQNRLVRLLSYAYKLNIENEKDRDIINILLKEAWNTLRNIGLLKNAFSGSYLDIEDVSLVLPRKGWICPVTQRFLDTTLRKITPYLPNKNVSDEFALCIQEVQIPQCNLLTKDFSSEENRLASIRSWLNETPEITYLRKVGIWSNLSDRIVEGGTYYRTAEHSAQISGNKLQDYERDFKSGRINLLSCSTTMEMGVDIGGISAVSMNNVPPHPANYLQRAGRAGRRSETRSIALTVCKNNPHDQQVFKNPLWSFKTELPAPIITLSSAVLVQRHINSLLLSTFLRKQLSNEESLNRLNMEWWMLPKGNSNANQFINWARYLDENSEAYLAKGLRTLIRYTCFDGVASLNKLAAQAASMLQKHCDTWYSEFDLIESQLKKLSEKKQESDPVYRAFSIQRGRLVNEYLLRELVTKGFLPGYGFPTDILTFETLTRDELVTRKKNKENHINGESRVDNVMRYRDLPNRDAKTALREYAPGSEIILDGLVYKSSGITLNWHAPADKRDIKEIQNIRMAWRCKKCGASGTSVSANKLLYCDECGEQLSDNGSESKFSYLEPAGFSVDFFETPHSDVSTQSFVPVELPWINADGEWLPFVNEKLGRFRASHTGSVFTYSSGVAGCGYAICLSCGRAVPMHKPDDFPFELYDEKGNPKVHKRLRGRVGGENSICEGSGNSYSIQRGIRLGYEVKTDVLEMVLCDLDGIPLTNRKVAYSLAVSIRAAIASMLGIEANNLGCETKPIRLNNNDIAQGIIIYDHAAAGYSSSITGQLREVFYKAYENLKNCPANCETACQHCLLDFDTRYRSEDLDRHLALEFLSLNWLKKFKLEDKYAYFGINQSKSEFQFLAEAITRELSRSGADSLNIYIPEHYEEWDFAASPLRSWIQKWAVNSPVKLILPTSDLNQISDANRFVLHILSNLDNVSIWKGIPPKCDQGGHVVAEVFSSKESIAWAYPSTEFFIPSNNWGNSNQDAILVTGPSNNSFELLNEIHVSYSSPEKMTGKAYALQIKGEIDGKAYEFGKKLVAYIQTQLSGALIDGEGDIIEVVYCDRYLNAPLPVALLLDFLSGIKQEFKDRWNVKNAVIGVAALPREKDLFKSPTRIFHNWPTEVSRREAIQDAFEYCGLQCQLITESKEKLDHARLLEIKTSDGNLTRIWFDQGFSYWKVPELQHQNSYLSRFDFRGTEQGKAIAEMKTDVEGNGFSTYIFIEKVKI